MTEPDTHHVQPLGFAGIDARVRAEVERVVADDPNPADPLRGLYITEQTALQLAREVGGRPDPDARLAAVGGRLGLDPLDLDILGVCAAPELDQRYGRLFAYLHDDVTRRLATPRLAARLLAGGGRTVQEVLGRFGGDAPLRSSGALRPGGAEDEPGRPLADRLVKVADAVAALLLGADLEHRVRAEGLWRQAPAPGDVGRPEAVERIRALVGASPTMLPAAVGPDALDVLVAARGAPVWVLAADAADADLLAEGRLRAALEGTWLVVTRLEAVDGETRRRIGARLSGGGLAVAVAARARDDVVGLGEGSVLVTDVPQASAEERRRAWATLSGVTAVDEVAAKFRLGPAQIARAVEMARVSAVAAGRDLPVAADLEAGARNSSSGRIGELARRLDTRADWERLVLPERPMALLRSIAAYLRHRDLVLADWGFAGTVGAAPGIKALFAGESGTGKTMSAQVLAGDLGLELFRIDLATVVSKYIGETEKNLDRVFEAAEGSNAILFFDEADALFGKRSEVSDAHDRYANIEVAYLLQRMETYDGAVVLATNLRQNIDEAFLRRLDVVVDFPFPEPPERERIWRLVLPPEAPVDDDLDLPFLGERFRLSGGGIRNAALAGAFLAAQDGSAIAMRHLVSGVAREYTKLGRLTLEADFKRFHAGL